MFPLMSYAYEYFPNSLVSETNDAFGGQKGNVHVLDNIVNIVYGLNNAKTDSATGVILHQVQDKDGNNMILTANHVARGTPPFLIFDHYGNLLGNATPYGSLYEGEFNPRYDTALISMVSIKNGYEKLRGLDISPERPTSIFEVRIKEPFGIMSGASGSPALNGKGQIMGILSCTNFVPSINKIKSDMNNLPFIQIPNMDYYEYGKGERGILRYETSQNIATFAPIGIVTNSYDDSNINSYKNIPVAIPGYPIRSAIIYYGYMTGASEDCH